MVILGALINAVEAFVGGVLGLALRSRVSSKLGDFLLQGQGLCVVLVGVQGMVAGGSVVVTTLAVALGGALGYWIDIDKRVHQLGDRVQRRLDAAFSGKTFLGNFSEGFVTSTLFTCVGAMAIVGSLSSGLSLDHSTLIAKGVIDLIVCVVMAATLGVGVPFCAVSIFVYEAIMSLVASFLAPALSSAVITEMGVTGSLLLFAVGTNLMKVTNIKVANFLPACFLPIALVPAFALLGL